MEPKKLSEDQLSDTEAAELLDVAKPTLSNWRWRKYGPPYLKIGKRVVYRRRDLEAWSDSQLRLNP